MSERKIEQLDFDTAPENDPELDELIAIKVAKDEIKKGEIKRIKMKKRTEFNFSLISEDDPKTDELIAIKVAEKEIEQGEIRNWREIKEEI